MRKPILSTEMNIPYKLFSMWDSIIHMSDSTMPTEEGVSQWYTWMKNFEHSLSYRTIFDKRKILNNYLQSDSNFLTQIKWNQEMIIVIQNTLAILLISIPHLASWTSFNVSWNVWNKIISGYKQNHYIAEASEKPLTTLNEQVIFQTPRLII